MPTQLVPVEAAPGAHKTSHQNSGNDEISVAGLSGALADAQTPSAHKTTHQDDGADEINATGLAGRCDFVDRGDPAAADFTQAALTLDAVWRDLDLSSIVPAGAKAVLLVAYARTPDVEFTINFRKNGNVNVFNKGVITSQVANVDFGGDVIVFLDANRVIEYMGEAATWSAVTITVRGWWI